MAEMIKMRTGNHKAEWSEDALIILEEFATAKVQGRPGACGRILPYVQKIIPLLEVEPRGEPPEEYLLMERRKGVHLSKQPKGASVLTTQQKMMQLVRYITMAGSMMKCTTCLSGSFFSCSLSIF